MPASGGRKLPPVTSRTIDSSNCAAGRKPLANRALYADNPSTMNSPAPKAMLHRPAGGFTLIELMVALAILAILVTIAAPSLRDAVLNARMTAQANDLMGDLNIARSEAVKRNQRVYLCTSTNGTTCTASQWRDGWMVFVDTNGNNLWNAGELPLKATPAFDAGNNLTVNNDLTVGGIRYVLYRPSGASNIANLTIQFIMCDARNTAAVGAQRAANRGRLIEINSTGRPVATRRTCANATT